MTIDEIREEFQFAILHRRKLEFRMIDTDDDVVILFNPHCIHDDQLLGKECSFGYIEKHYATCDTGYSKNPLLRNVKYAKTLNETFVPHTDWLDTYKKHGAEERNITFKIIA